MNFEKKIKILAKRMIEEMTDDEKDLILFIHLCDHLEQDEELFAENWSIYRHFDAKNVKGDASSKDMKSSLPDIFPAVYERLQKKL